MILDKIVADKKRRLPCQKEQISIKEMRRLAEEALKAGDARQHEGLTPKMQERETPFYKALNQTGLSIIGEFKKASPSLGIIKNKIELTDRIGEYNASVDAISCLTEEDHFQGSTEYLKQIRSISKLPILRKDFMIEEYQFYEAKTIGADAVLLIAAILDDTQMKDFYTLSRELHMAALVEVHDEQEMERALKLEAAMIGVNNRNLKDFSIHLDTTKRLSAMIPKETVFVSESGITGDEDVRFLKECRVDAFLIGRAFMEAENPRELAERWKAL